MARDGADVGVEEGRGVGGPQLRPLWFYHHRGGGLPDLPVCDHCASDTFQAGGGFLIFLSDFFQFVLFVIGTENYQRVLTAGCVGALPEFHLCYAVLGGGRWEVGDVNSGNVWRQLIRADLYCREASRAVGPVSPVSLT